MIAMRMGNHLILEQSQKLIMTPALKQAITVLHLPLLELSDYLQHEVAENPVLEIKETEEREQFEALVWQKVFAEKGYLGAPRGVARDADPAAFIENYLTNCPSLFQHLKLQLNLIPLTPQERAVGQYLIGNIDANGYLKLDLEEVCQKCQCTRADAETMLGKIQSLDPAGVGARDLTECLLLQMKAENIAAPEIESMVRHHLTDLAEGKWLKIARALGITPRAAQANAEVIKRLNPKPGSNFSNPETGYILPDVVVEKIGGEYRVLVNDSVIPLLRVNPLYQAMLMGRECDEDTRRFIEQKLRAAFWLLKSIEQRRLTMTRVVHCILEHQSDFFEKGIGYLKPLTLRQIAAALDVHESTVSRATANKYMQSPLGVFELKYFFERGVAHRGGASTSAQSVKRMLRELIAAGDAQTPYADRQLAELLSEKGVDISRRTVAKYRMELGIPAAMKRKRY